ncbi:MAG: hypothetical protein QOI64_1702 [Solirubrobacteraceae bacterium]|jgi:hypothetical protein|nr:hypothetical protein [Solirubrobacteraceae bacterium]
MSRATKEEDENWVGTPPEGFHSRDKADPEFWRAEWPKYAMGAGVLVGLVVLLVLIAVML